MAEDISAGKLSLTVEALLAGFGRKLQDQVDVETKRVQAKIKLKVDKSGFREDLKRVVDEASAELKAQVGYKLDTTTLRSDLREAVARASRGLSVTIRVTADTSAFERQIREAKAKADALGKAKGGKDSSGGDSGGLDTIKTVARFAAMASAAMAAVGAVTALGGAAVALVGALGPVVGAGAAATGIVSGLGFAAGAVKLAFSGVGGAMKAYQAESDAAAAKAAGLTLAQYKQQQAIDKLTQSQKNFAAYLITLKPKLDELKATAANNMLPGLQEGLKSSMTLFPVFKSGIAGVSGAIGSLGKSAGSQLAGLRPEFQNISDMATTTVSNLGAAAINGVTSLVRITSAGRGLTDWLTGQINKGAEFLAQIIKTKEANGQLAAFFEKTKVVLSQLGHIISNVGQILFGVFRGAAPLGGALLQSFVDLTARAAAWTKSVEGSAKIRGFFDALRPVLTELGRLLGALATGLAQIGSGAQKGLAPLIAKIRTELLPAILSIFKAFSNNGQALAPALVDLLTQLARLFATFTQVGGGMAGTVKAIADLAAALNWAVKYVPGFKDLLGVILAMVAVKQIKGALQPAIDSVGTLYKVSKASIEGVRAFWVVANGGSVAMAGASKATITGATIGDSMKGIVGAVSRGFQRLTLAVTNAAKAAWRTVVTGLESVGKAAIKLAQMAWGAIVSGLKGLGDGFKALGAAMRANPLITIIAGLVLLATALVALYKNNAGFRNFVTTVASLVRGVLIKAFHELGQIVQTITRAFVAAWNWVKNSVQAIWNAIVAAAKFVFNAIKVAIEFYFNLYKTIVMAVMHAIEAVWRAIWDAIRGAAIAVWNAIRSVVEGAINGVKNVVQAVMNTISGIWGSVWNTIKSIAQGAWDFVSRGVGGFLGGIRDAFSSAVGFIGSVWSGIKAAVAAPVHFVVDTVYDQGIVPVVNTIAGWVGINNPLGPVHFAGGGVVPGNHDRDDVGIYATPGEVVVPKPVVRAAGGAEALMGALGFGPRTGGAGGHFSLGGLVSRGLSAIGGAASSVVGTAADLARSGAASVLDSTVGPLVRQLEGFAANYGGFGRNISGGIDKLYQSFLTWVKAKDAEHASSAPGGGGSVERWRPVVDNVLRMLGLPLTADNGVLSLISSESSGNPNAINLTDSNAQAGHPSQGLMQTIPSTFTQWAGQYASRGITDAFANVYAGVRYAVANYGIGMLMGGGRHTAGGAYQGYALGGTVLPRSGGTPVVVGEAGAAETITDTRTLRQGFARLEAMLAKAGLVINTTINNPSAEPASESTTSVLRRLHAQRLLPA